MFIRWLSISYMLSSTPTVIPETMTGAVHRGPWRKISMSNARLRDNCLTRRLPYTSIQTAGLRYLCLVLLLTCLFSQGSSSPTPDRHKSSPPTTKLYNTGKTFAVRAMTATSAAVSMTASFIVFYWFCRMEKRFRHRYSPTFKQ
jgi:hypothetical protein